MSTRVAINGPGRSGRAILKLVLDEPTFELVAVNDLVDSVAIEERNLSAKFVLLSAPSKGGEVETVVHGVNAPGGQTSIVSCASCTTNRIAPIVEIVGRRIGVKKAVDGNHVRTVGGACVVLLPASRDRFAP